MKQRHLFVTVMICAILFFSVRILAQDNQVQLQVNTNPAHSGDTPSGITTTCAASGGCDEYIGRVQAGSIDNSTVCTGYADFTSTQVTSMPRNGVLQVTVTNGNPYPPDQCGIWVDWNRNGVFTDPGEQVTVNGNPGNGPYSATVLPDPNTVTPGNCIMRIRIIYTGTLSPCGVTQYGEVEDYTVNINNTWATNVWTGSHNHDWNDAANWSLLHKPLGVWENVEIPNVNMPCNITNTFAFAGILTMDPGTTLLVGGSANLSCMGMDISGQIAMDNNAGVILTSSVVNWRSGSSVNFTGDGTWNAQDASWTFDAGSNVQFSYGTVKFIESSPGYISNKSSSTRFHNMEMSGSELQIDAASTQDITVSGTFYIDPGFTFKSYSDYAVVLQGPFNNSGHFHFYAGTLVMNGAAQTLKPNTGDAVYNLTINSIGTTTFDNTYVSTLPVNGNLLVQSGSLNPMNNMVAIGGDWTDLAGPAGFIEGTSRVIFNGGGAIQHCSDESFYILEVNKPGYIYLDGATVTCAAYDWTAGGIEVFSGTFTANDLLDNGIYGSNFVFTGGTLNLHNANGWVDLNGNIFISGGTFNVYGGNNSDSYWPFTSNGSVTMLGGVLDFKDVGILVNNSSSFSFAQNITGGTIRTSRSFNVDRSDYLPSGGTVELYGSTDATFHTINGSYVRNVIINKLAADNPGTGTMVRNRETMAVTDAPLSNTINLNGMARIKGNLTIQSGVLNAGNNTMYVEGDWNDAAGASGFLEGTGTVEFNGANTADILSEETFYNLKLNKTSAASDGLDLLNNVYCLNDLRILDGTMHLTAPANLSVSGNLAISQGAGLNSSDDYGPVTTVGKNWTDSNNGYDVYHGYDPGGFSTVSFTGTGDQYVYSGGPVTTFVSLYINKTTGRFRPSVGLDCHNSVQVVSGIWEDSIPGLTHAVWCNFSLDAAGAIYNSFAMNTFEFKSPLEAGIAYHGAGGFHNLVINKSGGTTLTMVSDASCLYGGTLNVLQGLYNLNGHTLSVTGNAGIFNTGTLKLTGGSKLLMSAGQSLNVNSGGILTLSGTPLYPVNIRSAVPSTYYYFNVNSGGTIAADYCLFQNMGTSGVNVTAGGTVDVAHMFKGCTFQDGIAGGTLLTVNNTQALTIRNAVFPSNTWAGSSNITKTANSGHVYMVDYSGAFSGESYDADAFNRVDWMPALTAAASADPTAVCPGTPSTLNVIPSGGLAPYTYIWGPTASLTGITSVNPVATPLSTTTYYVTVTDALGTTTTANTTIAVYTVLPASVSINASANPVPPATTVMFTAAPVNGGPTPSYQWKVNGDNVGVGLSTFSYMPSYNDQVSCVMTSSYACPSGSPATSNTISMIVVNANSTVNATLTAPQSLCFDASNILTVAGGGDTFVVQDGASAVMIAGVKISFLPGASVQHGGYLHGYITTTNGYCGSITLPMMAVAAGESDITPLSSDAKDFTIYPNPTTGRFTLARKDGPSLEEVSVSIYSMHGELYLSKTCRDEHAHEFDMTGLNAGMYFVKVIRGNQAAVFKVVLTR